MSNDRYVQCWSGFNNVGAASLVAASAAEFNLGAFSDLVAGVLFKIGPGGVPVSDAAGWPARVLWGNSPDGGAGWYFKFLVGGSGEVLVLVAYAAGVACSVRLADSSSSAFLNEIMGVGIVDKLIFAVLHWDNAAKQLDLYVNGNRCASTGPGQPVVYAASPSAPIVGIQADGQYPAGGIEIAGVCFSRFTAIGVAGGLQGNMVQAYRSTHENNSIGPLYDNGAIDWDHRYNAEIGEQTSGLVQGPNGGYYYPTRPMIAKPVLDAGNEGAFAAPSSPSKINLTGDPTNQLQLITTRNPDWFPGAVPLKFVVA
jgi:hypothetical protein